MKAAIKCILITGMVFAFFELSAQSPLNRTLYWWPAGGGSGNILWSTVSNWSTSPTVHTPPTTVPNATDAAMFDGTIDNSSCTMDYTGYSNSTTTYLGALRVAATYTGTITDTRTSGQWNIGYGNGATLNAGINDQRSYILGGTFIGNSSLGFLIRFSCSVEFNATCNFPSTDLRTQGDTTIISGGTFNLNASLWRLFPLVFTGNFFHTGGTINPGTSDTRIIPASSNGSNLNMYGNNFSLYTASIFSSTGVGNVNLTLNGQVITVNNTLDLVRNNGKLTLLGNAASRIDATSSLNLVGSGTSSSLDINSPVTVTASGNVNITGGWSAFPDGGNGTVMLVGGNAQTLQRVGGTYGFPNFVVRKTTGSVATLITNMDIASNLTILSGTLDLGTYTFNRKSAGGTLLMDSLGYLIVRGTSGGFSGSNFPTSFNTYTLQNSYAPSATGSTVEFATAVQSLANVTYYNLTCSGNVQKNPVANTTVNGNFTINDASTLVLYQGTGYNLTVRGNFTNNGIFNQGTSGTERVILDGSSNSQLIQGTSVTSFNNLTLNNTYSTAPQFTANTNFNVINNLTMTSGRMNLNGNTVTSGQSTATPGSVTHSNTSASGWFYNGTMVRWFSTSAIAGQTNAGLFPLGQANDFCPFWLGCPSALTAGGTVSAYFNFIPSTNPASHFDASWNYLVQAVTKSTWDINTANGFDPGGTNINIYYGGGSASFGTNSLGDIAASLSNSSPGTYSPASNNYVAYEVTRLALTRAELNNSFATQNWRMTTRDSEASPLPVTLVSFDVSALENYVSLVNWKVASEAMIKQYRIYRSNDGINFSYINTLQATNSSNGSFSYTTTDPSITEPGIYYYKLESEDINGVKKTMGIAPVTHYNYSENFVLFPNPASGSATLILPEGEYTLTLYNSSGSAITRYSGNFSYHRFNLSELPAGMYFVKITDGFSKDTFTRLIVTK